MWDFDYVPDSMRFNWWKFWKLLHLFIHSFFLFFFLKKVECRSCDPNALTCVKHVHKSTASQLWQTLWFWCTSLSDCASIIVTMYSVGPTSARQRLSELTAKVSGPRFTPRATTLPIIEKISIIQNVTFTQSFRYFSSSEKHVYK